VITRTYPPGFLAFWAAYACPRRRDKPGAFGVWVKLDCEPDAATVLSALARFQQSREWAEGYMPEPARWLKREPWDDEPVEVEAPQAPDWGEPFNKRGEDGDA